LFVLRRQHHGYETGTVSVRAAGGPRGGRGGARPLRRGKQDTGRRPESGPHDESAARPTLWRFHRGRRSKGVPVRVPDVKAVKGPAGGRVVKMATVIRWGGGGRNVRVLLGIPTQPGGPRAEEGAPSDLRRSRRPAASHRGGAGGGHLAAVPAALCAQRPAPLARTHPVRRGGCGLCSLRPRITPQLTLSWGRQRAPCRRRRWSWARPAGRSAGGSDSVLGSHPALRLHYD